ncbi:MAG: prepilin-type N-terminal cleavage/methylation domain-containing protein [Myxococcota bacterium]
MDRPAGFTLLEILAVLLIGALLMSFMVPNLSALDSRALQSEAQKLVALIDLGRQRSVVTGSPHRLVIDIEHGRYGLEWERTDPSAETQRPAPDDLTYASDDPLFTRSDRISLAPPASAESAFAPLPGLMGRVEPLPHKIEFTGVETSGGWVNLGEVIVRFERDGSSSFSEIVLADSGGHEAHLEILPLADSVRIVYEEP